MGSSTLGSKVDSLLRLGLSGCHLNDFIVGVVGGFLDLIVLALEPVIELLNVLILLSVDLCLELGDEFINIGVELLHVRDLLLLEVDDHVVEDALDVAGSLVDLLLAQLHGLLVLLLLKLIP